MPSYTFKCSECKHVFETFIKFEEDEEISCPICKNKKCLKVYEVPTVIFKGNGFYTTDSKKGGNSGDV